MVNRHTMLRSRAWWEGKFREHGAVVNRELVRELQERDTILTRDQVSAHAACPAAPVGVLASAQRSGRAGAACSSADARLSLGRGRERGGEVRGVRRRPPVAGRGGLSGQPQVSDERAPLGSVPTCERTV